MKHQLEQLLDSCLTQLNTGVDLEQVLAENPAVADELRPLLVTAMATRLHIPPPLRKAERKEAFLAQVAARRREVETVEGYVVELRAGVPLAELLERAPTAVRPLVLAAWRMYDTPPPMPSAERIRDGKRQLMALAARRRAARVRAATPSWLARLSLGLSGARERLMPESLRYRRVWSGALGASLAVLVLFVGVSGMGSASASSLPGQPFYHVKRLGESAQMLFAFDPVRRAELNLKYTERRLQEMRQLGDQEQPVPIAVVEDWLRAQSSAWADIQALPADQRQALLELLVDLVGSGQQFEDRLHTLVTDHAALDELLEQSAGLVRSVRRSEEPPVLVATPLPTDPVGGVTTTRPVPLPEERPTRAAPPPAVQQPPAVAPALPPAPVAQPPAQPPVLAPPAEDPDDDDRPAAPVATDPVVATEPTATPEPPPIIVPPLEDPNGGVIQPPSSGGEPGAP